ncbi:NAD-dependent epimerase/dehydratase family protein (macronuclear) [Tetrahymena thermophila SB210]|uniref:NAD-dependent epimerase/dehydratase family protein n=1 Tax=Tetrahymena thermophila (strain SB210) TaxID=312017 RepID=Q23U83_TETTS|nr:NAD-dependent epimerase/dehydratase family protein [Tetrahymena thermophila SB210]EAS00061.1 NAD-dependent epimerase/dehydratase family protein [Tetrahymena thermophila SB210]|eukprot:XP_001020306.1 NAD-dependent epimerase/dehydratase family protein [Tetrahymena thermophila SB210]
MNPENGIILVVGGTGRTGYHVVQELLSKNFQIRLISRNRKSAEESFKQDLIQMESVFECDLFQEAKMQKSKIESGKEVKSILDLAFEPSRKGLKVQAVVSALGYNYKSSDDSRIVEETVIQLLIQLCKKHNVKNFILTSSMCVTRPYHFVSYLINSFASNALGYKVYGENALRESGLNYIIVRPGGLVGTQKDKKTTNYTIEQGDRSNGRITRATVAKIIVEALQAQNLPKQLTFECYSTKQQSSEEYQPFNGSQLKPDDESSIVRGNHVQAKRMINLVLVSLLAISLAFLYKRFF